MYITTISLFFFSLSKYLSLNSTLYRNKLLRSVSVSKNFHSHHHQQEQQQQRLYLHGDLRGDIGISSISNIVPLNVVSPLLLAPPVCSRTLSSDFTRIKKHVKYIYTSRTLHQQQTKFFTWTVYGIYNVDVSTCRSTKSIHTGFI